MRKKTAGKQLSRDRGSREALFRSLSRAFILNGSIVTTRAKAKAVQPELEKLVTLTSRGDLSARRAVLARLANDRKTTDLLFEKYKTLDGNRKSGFTRLTNMPTRRGDNAQMARLEWVDGAKEKNVKEDPKKENTK